MTGTENGTTGLKKVLRRRTDGRSMSDEDYQDGLFAASDFSFNQPGISIYPDATIDALVTTPHKLPAKVTWLRKTFRKVRIYTVRRLPLCGHG
jgi:hypothetical protein